MGFFTARPQSSFINLGSSFDVYFPQRIVSWKCRETFTCKLERMADTNEWSVFLMAALATFSCCVASLNIPFLITIIALQSDRTENSFSTHLWTTRYHHGNAWTKMLKDKKKEKRVSHKAETTRRCLLSFVLLFKLVKSPLQTHLTISIYCGVFFPPLSQKIPLLLSLFFPGRGINRGLSVRRCGVAESRALWFPRWLALSLPVTAHLLPYTLLGRQRRATARERKAERQKWELVGEA